MKEKNKAPQKAPVSISDKFIMMCEDDIDDQEILEEVFMSIDPTFQLRFFNNGKKLVTYLQDVRDGDFPCLIVLDYNMPELNGAEILKNLRTNARLQQIPKIIWSTSNAPAYKSVCLELGASAYLVKPSKITVLEEMVKHMLSYC